MSDLLQPAATQEVAASGPEPREWHFHDIIPMLYRRRWIAVATFVIVAAAVTAYTLTATRIYEAHAELLLEEKPSIVTFAGAGESAGDPKGYLETQHRILRSRSLARRVIDELDLWKNPAFASTQRETSTGAFVKGWWDTPRTSSPTNANGDEKITETVAIDRMLSNLTVLPVRDTRIIEVRYESTDPEVAARIVNALTSAYIKQNLEARSHASKEASVWLTEQLAEQRRKVETSELSLQKYRERGNSLSLDAGQNIVVQRLNALNSSVTQAKTDRIAIESLYRQLAASQSDPVALDTFPQIRSNSVVGEIRARLANLRRDRMQFSGTLGAKHPEMVRLETAINLAERELAAEVAKTVDSVRQEYVAAASKEKELTVALDSQKASALALNRQGIEYGVLLREVESNRQIYQSLLQRANEIAVSSNLQGNNIEIVDAAEVPRAPVRPNTRANLLIGLLISAILALGVALVFEAIDDRIQTPADVKYNLRIPFLGMLPYLSKRMLKGGTPLLGESVPAAYAEACRALRTNILASAGANGNRSLLVTSAAPGDGKSVLSVNLAVALGRSGKRVLLIDADLRRPRLHDLLGREQRPGLAEILTGARKPSEAIASTRCSGVWLLPSGAAVSNPSEQLGSRRFKEFLEKLTESFDWVIIDSPPVMAVTDPAVIARVVSGVLFVINARRTNQKIAQAALDRLEAAGASFAGAVLNGVTLDRDHYYNSRYYLPFYGEYIREYKRSA
jgi:polysaccharide biosynthesis transport protein